jgi:hypothetical protein
MNAEQIIAEIECLEQLFRLPDTRSPLNLDRTSANQKRDETYHDDPRFRPWRPDDV